MAPHVEARQAAGNQGAAGIIPMPALRSIAPCCLPTTWSCTARSHAVHFAVCRLLGGRRVQKQSSWIDPWKMRMASPRVDQCCLAAHVRAFESRRGQIWHGDSIKDNPGVPLAEAIISTSSAKTWRLGSMPWLLLSTEGKGVIPRDPSTWILPALGPNVFRYYLLWAIWNCRVWHIVHSI